MCLAPDGDRIDMRTSPHRGKFDATGSQDAHERQLLNSVAAGDQEAISELYELYFPRLFKFLYRLSHDYGLTEEVVNDVMLVVWRSADNFRGESKVSTWILGIAYRQCMKKLRKHRLPQAADNDTRDAADHGSNTIELNDVIAKALAELSPEHRMMIESVLYLGMTYREVAQIAGCPVNTAKTRVHNARKKLREILSRLGYVSGVNID